MKQISYTTFRKFLDSDMDELEYFHVNDKANVISLEEHIKDYDEKTKLYLEEIKPILVKLHEKNSWISEIENVNNGKIFLGSDDYNVGGVTVKKNKNGNFSNALGYEDSFSFISNVYDCIRNTGRIHSLNKYSHDDLVELDTIGNDIFGTRFDNNITTSGVFLVKNYRDMYNISVENKKNIDFLMCCFKNRDRYEGYTTGRFYDNSHKDSNNLHNSYMANSSCKRLVKKLCVYTQQ